MQKSPPCDFSTACLASLTGTAASQVGSLGAVHFPDADITFKSIDGVKFKAHKNALACLYPGFLRNIESSIDSEETILPEKSSVLERMRFRPLLLMDVQVVGFDVVTVEALGNAGEKYGVYYAIIGCWIFM